MRATIGVPPGFYPTLGINIGMIAAIAAIYAQSGLARWSFVLLISSRSAT